jgi:hypothetical protein
VRDPLTGRLLSAVSISAGHPSDFTNSGLV